MKKTNSKLVFGAFVVACFAAVRCGGDDSNSTPAGTAGATSGTAGSAGSADNGGSADNAGSTGMGGSANSAGTANNGGSDNTAGTASNGGANNNGGNVTPKDGGGTGGGAAGGPQIGGDAGMCPGMAPMNNAACTGNVTCEYPSMRTNFDLVCTCRATGMRIDGGERERVFTCGDVFVPPPRDAGPAPADAGIARCANGTSDGDRCTTASEVCRLGNNSACVCFEGANQMLQWFCN